MESWQNDVGAHVPKDARVGSYGIGSVSYPTAHDPTHRKAWKDVEHGTVDYAEVRDVENGGISFRAWRVSAESWAWQTPAMAAPAFARYAPHDEPITDQYGTFCSGCRNPLRVAVQS